MKRALKILSTLLTVILVAALTIGIIGPARVQAASKKTVRVSTQKELNKALKNSKVGTIILRTPTYDKITINTKKAKKKKIIIDAPSAVVENKSKFKSIEVQGVSKYIENYSGNSITCAYPENFVIADGKTVKKLTITEFYTNYIVGKDASITSLVYNIEGKKSTVNKKNNQLKLTQKVGVGEYYVDYHEVPVEYTLTVDAAGRIIALSYKDTEGKLRETTVKYDDNGNFTEVKEVYAKTGDTIFVKETKYDKEHNLTYNHIEGEDSSDTDTYKYDSKGRLKEITYDTSYGAYMAYKYEYDSNDRRVKSDCSYTSEGWSYHYISEKTYDSNGFILSNTETYDEGYAYISEYEYDKSGNQTYSSRKEQYTDGNSALYEYKTTYDKYGEILDQFIKFPGEDEWYNFDDLGD